MKLLHLLRRYLLPAVFGLVTYATVRLLNDTISRFYFWERPWQQNLLEAGMSMLLGYAQLATCDALLRYFDRRGPVAPEPRQLLRELLTVAVVTTGLNNAVFLPLAAFTDDGLSWGDTTIINTVPLLFMLIYYGWVRSHHFLRKALGQQLQLEQAAREQALTELKFLRAQYHPHFLFNALNTVYFQMDEDVAAAKRSVEQLADLLRYQLYDQQQPVPISQELRYLRSYLALQQVRSSEKLQLTLDLDPRLHEQQLYPLLLLPLLENAFKYVGGAYTIEVRARLTAAGLDFEVRNAVAAAPVAATPSPAAPGGIGLTNLRRRLELLYPGQHALDLAPTPTHFMARLRLALHSAA